MRYHSYITNQLDLWYQQYAQRVSTVCTTAYKCGRQRRTKLVSTELGLWFEVNVFKRDIQLIDQYIISG